MYKISGKKASIGWCDECFDTQQESLICFEETIQEDEGYTSEFKYYVCKNCLKKALELLENE